MKVKVCNLGVIKQAEIDLKPLTIFVGPKKAKFHHLRPEVSPNCSAPSPCEDDPHSYFVPQRSE